MRSFISLLLVLHAALLSAQVVKFHKTFGGSSVDEGRSVKQTYDHGYIVAGATSSMGAGGMDVFLIKTDSMGMHQWSRTYGGMNSEWGYSVLQVQDSGYVVAGYTNSYGAGGYDMYLIRTDKDGDTLWTKTYGGTNWDFAYSLQQTTDGGYILAGTTASYGMGNDDVYLVKTDANGDTLWTRTYGTSMNDEGHSVWQNTDGGYFINGFTDGAGNGAHDVYYIRTDAAGAETWSRTLGDTGFEESYSGQQTFDGGFVMAGYSNSFSSNGADEALLVKTDMNGDTLWTRRYGSPNNARAYSIQETVPDHGFIWCGYLELGNKQVYMFRTDPNGYYFTSTTHGFFTGDQAGYSVRTTADGCYVLAGTTSSISGQNDVYLIKTDSMCYTSAYNSIDEPKEELAIVKVIPNPVVSSSVFLLPDDLITQTLTLRITDITGREVRMQKDKSNAFVFEKNHLDEGIYFYSFYAEDGTRVAAGKIMIH